MRRHLGLAAVSALVLGVLFALWTWLALGPTFSALDSTSLRPGVTADSAAGQVLAAIAVLTMPVVVYTTLAGVAWWAARRRLHNLAWAIGISIPLTWSAVTIVKQLTRRARPDTALPLISAEGFAYPSGHMAAVTVLAVMLIATMVVTRRRRPWLVLGSGVLVALWWVVLADRWLLRAHWFSDLIAGGLLGGAVASLSLALGGVHIARLVAPNRHLKGTPKRAAVVYNPIKVPDPVVFRRQVEGACEQRGWELPLWLETDPSDAGTTVARAARKRKVDLVLVAGGDGTVRTACAQLASSGIPVGILPVGTGNLLARNLEVPLDLGDALDVAFDGTPRAIDLVEVRADHGEAEHSLVMAGLGADALIMAETNPDLKRVVGSAAYVMAALGTITRPPFSARVALDEGGPLLRRPAMVLAANVGAIQGQVMLAPDAVPDDGQLDVVVASPERWADWGAITTRILVRAADAPGVERAQVSRLVVETDAPVPYQIDGDALGECSRLEASVLPGAVIVMTP